MRQTSHAASSGTALVLACLLALSSCAAPTPPSGDPPAFLTARDLAPVVVVSGPERGTGSGIALAADVILTCDHVIDELPTDEHGIVMRVGGRPVVGTLLARGDASVPHGDWALVRVDRPSWSPSDVAWVRAPSPSGAPAPGSEVWLIGYPNAFYPDRAIDVRKPPRVLRAAFVAEEDAQSWAVSALPWDLAGISGGGVFVWSPGEERLELVAFVVGQTEVATRLEGPLGVALPLGDRQTTRVHRLPAEACAVAARRAD